MFVKDVMDKKSAFLDADDSLRKALDALHGARDHIIPVMSRGKLGGVLTEHNLRRPYPREEGFFDVKKFFDFLENNRVRRLMTTDPLVVLENESLQEAAGRMLDRDVSMAVVKDINGNVTGTVSRKAILNGLLAATGHGKEGMTIALRIDERAGALKDATDVIRKHGGSIHSILSLEDESSKRKRQVCIRMKPVAPDSLERMKLDLEPDAEVLYTLDHGEDGKGGREKP
ncbi:CBS domain-containing protein [Thermodesulfobacteriota bacterium]